MPKGGGKRVLLYDKSKKWADSAKEVLVECGFQVDMETHSFEECFRQAADNVYVAAVINVHSLDDARSDLSRFSAKFQAVGLIIVEDRQDPEIDGLLWPPNPIAHLRFGNKQDHLVTDLPTLVENFVRLRGMLPGEMDIILPEGIDDILTGCTQTWSGITRIRGGQLSLRVLKDELTIVVSQLFAGALGDQPIARRIQLEAFGEEGGHSGSGMFKLTPTIILDSAPNKSAVLKFGPKEDINKESRNYDKFVEWFLTVEHTVRKIAYAQGSHFAGILYSYPRDVAGGYIPYAQYIRKQPIEKCIKIVEDMFSKENRHWYLVNGSRFVHPDETRFQTYYVKHVIHASLSEMRTHHFEKMKKEITNLEKKTKDAIWELGSDTITFPALNLSISNPINYLLEPIIDRLTMTIIHGDLHGHNILIDERDRFFLLDFYYCGFGDAYRDFQELELSVRYDIFCSRQLPDNRRLVSTDSSKFTHIGIKKLVRLENALIQKSIYGKEPKDPLLTEDPDIRKAYEIITAIRRLAKENFPENIRHYYMGLAMSSLKALKYFYPLDVKIHRLILSGLYVDLIKRGQIK